MNKDVLLPNEDNPLIWVNPDRLSGAPCFYKTRVPVEALFGNLAEGLTLDEFLDCFPDVRREQALAVLEFTQNAILPAAA
jgi:uncharacterized protein (DUF433 family)